MAVDSNDPIFSVIAFLTGTTTASLFFVIQSNLSHDFLLLTSLGTASMLFMLATIGRLSVTTGRIAKNSKFSYAVSWMTIAGLFLLLLSLLWLLFRFNPLSGIIAIIVFAGGYMILNSLERESKL